MATGTGLPINKREPVLVQPGGIVPQINADAYSTAADWKEIAAAGSRLQGTAEHALHTARASYLAGEDIEISRKKIELRDQFAHDPDGFDAAWSGYRDGKLGQAEPWAVDHLSKLLGQRGNTGYSEILGERRARDRQQDGERFSALASMTGSEVVGAAMAGGIDSEDGQIKVAKYLNVLESAVTSGLMTPEKRDLLFDTTMAKARGEEAARVGVQIYREKGMDAAVEHLRKNILENQSITLKGESRHQAFNRGLAAIRLQQSADKEDRVAVTQHARDLEQRISSNQPYEDAEVSETLDALARSGAAAQHRRLSVAHAVQRATEPYRTGLNLRELSNVVATQRVAAMAPVGTAPQVAAVTAAANRLGVPARDLAAAISYETGGRFDPNIVGGKGNNYVGLIQFGPEERQKYGVRPGMTFEQQMVAVEGFLRDRGVKPGMGLAEIYRTINGGNPNASLNAADGNGTIAQHIERIRNGHYGSADKFLGTPGSAEPGPYAGEIAKRVQGTLVEQARKAWPDFKARIDQGRVLDQEDFQAIRYAALLSGDANWQQEVETKAVANGIGQQMAAVPIGQRQAVVDQARQQLTAEVADSLQKQVDRQRKVITESPVDFAIESGRPAPAPLDLSTPEKATAAINERVQIARAVAQEQETPIGSPFRPAETASLAGAIGSGDPARASAAFNALAAVPDDAVGPTLSAGPIKDAILGSIRSPDAGRYIGAMQFMDRLWARSPEQVKALFNEEAIHALMTWQTNARYMSPEQIAKQRERSALEPQVRERMKAAQTEGEREARKWSVDEVVKQFDESWLPWGNPGAPTDALTRDRLMGDFVSLFGRRYAETDGDADAASKQALALMKVRWKPSKANGGALMLDAPEHARDKQGRLFFPDFGGGHDWMVRDLENWIATKTGKAVLDDDPTATAPRRNFTYSLVSDRQTRAEIEAGQRPSYTVVVKDPETGRSQPIEGRISWDPSDEEERRRPIRERARVIDLNRGQTAAAGITAREMLDPLGDVGAVR